MSKLLSEEDRLRCSDEAVVTLPVHRTNIAATYTLQSGFCLLGNASIATRDHILLRKRVQNDVRIHIRAGRDGTRDTGWGILSGTCPGGLHDPRANQALHQRPGSMRFSMERTGLEPTMLMMIIDRGRAIVVRDLWNVDYGWCKAEAVLHDNPV